MRIFSRLRDHRFCAFCKTQRRVYIKKHADLTNVVGALLLSLAVTLFAWGGPDPRGFVLFCFAISVSEVFVYLRWRFNVVCSMCGFDPLVYKRSPARASALVKEFFEANKNDPKFWMTRSPLVKLQMRIRLQERQKMEQRELRDHTSRRIERQSLKAPSAATSSLPPAKTL
jgi:hypothetical protein